MAERNLFELLREKSILAILDGDEGFGEIETTDLNGNIEISMPYLSGPALCDISNRFGLPVTYGWNGIYQSRWAYLDDLLEHCIKNNRESDLLAFLFSKGEFVDKLKGYTPEVIESAYTKIVETVISKINGILYFGGNELVMVGDSFVIEKIGTSVKVAAPLIKTIDRDYIVKLSERAMQDVMDGNYDSAITKSRTLLEEVFCYVIEKKNETPSESGDIGKLYNQVKQLYDMHQDRGMDNRINGLLSGLEKILSAIAEMRNKGSDSHGIGAKRINISEHHARLFVNSAMTMADFVLAVGDRSAG
ncbi:MAG: abortive infection family protein [Syntrophomonadaceae bacterium]|nr:abortive infection family protein [Syntrophomonadaceae bacterium]